MNFVEKVFGTHSDRELKYIYPIIDKIEKLRPTMQAMSDEAVSYTHLTLPTICSV